MSGLSTGVIKIGGSNSAREKSPPKGYFSIWKTILLIVSTLVISVAGWYAAGYYFFWETLDSKRIEDQLMYLQQQVQAQPKNTELRIALGYTYFLKGKNEQAIKEINEVLKVDKNNYDAYYNLGLIYSDESKLDDALEMFQQAVKISPREYKAFVQRGIVYRKLGMFKEAMTDLEKADKLSPRNADIIYEIGLVAEAKGDKKLAADIFKESLKYDPLFKEPAKALERVQ